MNNDYLIHHGVKGMKWGIRHDPNPNYSQAQRIRDKGVYGSGGVRRINKRMNKGLSISAARSKEADRIYNSRRRSVVTGQVGSVVGSIGGAVGGYVASKYVSDYMTKMFPTYMNDPMAQIAVKSAVSIGAASVGKTLGHRGGQSIGMLSGGYSPRKFRYR